VTQAPRIALVVGSAAEPASTATVLARFGFDAPQVAPTLEAALAQLESRRIDLLMLPLAEVDAAGLAALERALQGSRVTFVIGTAANADPQLIVRGLRAGIHEFLTAPVDPTELAAAVDRFTRRVTSEVTRGQVIAVHSSKGGLGNTSIAVNLAFSLARNHPSARVALGDLVVASGDVRVFLNVDPAYHLADLAEKLDRADAELLYSLLTPVEGGVWVLPSPDNPELDDQLDGTTIGSAIEALRTHFAFTVLDCEHHLSERALAAMDAADRIVLVTQLNVAALKSTQRTLAVCRRLGYDASKLCVVVNRHQRDDVLSLKDAAKVLTTEVAATLPNHYALAFDSITHGVPLTRLAPQSELTAAFDRLAVKLGGAPSRRAGSPPVIAAAPSPLGRIFGRMRRA
jgi:pilus assembly protein CpaE